MFNDSEPKVNEKPFNWKSIYEDVTENTTSSMSEPRGNAVILSMFTDAAFAGDLVTRRSQSGILIFLNRALGIVSDRIQ